MLVGPPYLLPIYVAQCFHAKHPSLRATASLPCIAGDVRLQRHGAAVGVSRGAAEAHV